MLNNEIKCINFENVTDDFKAFSKPHWPLTTFTKSILGSKTMQKYLTGIYKNKTLSHETKNI